MDGYAIVIFDGECGFCDRSVKWIINHDRAGKLRFVSRQSAMGQTLLARHGFPPQGIESMILIDGDRVSTHSSAVCGIAGKLPMPWKLGAAWLIVPKPVRDACYRFIARRRYRLARRKEDCPVPTAAQRARILDDVPVSA